MMGICCLWRWLHGCLQFIKVNQLKMGEFYCTSIKQLEKKEIRLVENISFIYIYFKIFQQILMNFLKLCYNLFKITCTCKQAQVCEGDKVMRWLGLLLVFRESFSDQGTFERIEMKRIQFKEVSSHVPCASLIQFISRCFAVSVTNYK